jgi:endonuclease/exonuclease/phosphatase family metal-dependent hydrolase
VTFRALIAALALAGAAVSDAGDASRGPAAFDPTCLASSAVSVRWVRAAETRERPSLDRWCAGVGPPAHVTGKTSSAAAARSITVISWNTHIGSGDIDGLVTDLRAGKLTGQPVDDFILLLQEVYRSGSDVPVRDNVAWAAAEIPVALKNHRVEVLGAAQRLGLWGIYVPSMRNGRPHATTEDRGNAILSTRPLSELTAIELPLERQRRVAIAATVTIGGQPVRIVCTHFTNMVMHHLWVLSESGRLRQARSLSQQLPADGALIVGGDFNAWFGFHDAAYRELARRLAHPSSEDTRPTFGPLRLDHLLFRLPAGWRSDLRRGDNKYGSDHYPLISTIALDAGRAAPAPR